MRVLVTGANGQLGRTLKELYVINNENIDFVFVTKADLDITKEKELKQFFKTHHFDYCINCAAYTDVEQAERTPKMAFNVNAEGVKYLAEACKNVDTILIHISTDYVFDGEKTEAYTVKDKPNPINEYGKSKLEGEKHIKNILEKYFIVRTSWLYSKKYGHNFYRTILEKTKAKNELFITDEHLGCPTNTENLSRYLIQLIKLGNKNYGIFHYSNSRVMTWYDFAEEILIENNLFSKIKLTPSTGYETIAKRPIYSVLE